MGGVFMIGVSAEHRAAAKVTGGEVIDVDLELDTAPREVEVPADFAAALDARAGRPRDLRPALVQQQVLARAAGQRREDGRDPPAPDREVGRDPPGGSPALTAGPTPVVGVGRGFSAPAAVPPARAIASTAAGFSRADVSPGSRPSQAARATRRMTLPLRVRGRSGTATTARGRTGLPRSRTTSWPDLAGDPLVPVDPGSRDAQDHDRLALELVRDADRGGGGDRGVGHRAGLHLGRADPLAGDLEGVVGAAVDVPEAVGVGRRPVAVDPETGHRPPVRVEVALVVRLGPEAAGHPRPRGPDRQLADRAPDRPSGRVHDVGRHPDARPVERGRPDRPEERAADDPAADLGPAGVVDDRQPAAADDVEGPAPGIRVPRLAGRADDPERRRGRGRGRAPRRGPGGRGSGSGSPRSG